MIHFDVHPPQCASRSGDRRTGNPLGLRGLGLILGLLVLGRCEASEPALRAVTSSETHDASTQLETSRMWMTVGEQRFAITLVDNAAARALLEQLPLALDMSKLNGNEKYASLPQALPTSPSKPGAIRIGDLMLYGKDTLVVFYATFRSSYSYTRLGSVDELEALPYALGRDGVRVVFAAD